jgi:hypothetical protein
VKITLVQGIIGGAIVGALGGAVVAIISKVT